MHGTSRHGDVTVTRLGGDTNRHYRVELHRMGDWDRIIYLTEWELEGLLACVNEINEN